MADQPRQRKPRRGVVELERLIGGMVLGLGPHVAGQLARPLEGALGRRLLEQQLEDPVGEGARQRGLSRWVGQPVDVAETPAPGALLVHRGARRREVGRRAGTGAGQGGVFDDGIGVGGAGSIGIEEGAVVEELHSCSSTPAL